jgi:hypothetical protein
MTTNQRKIEKIGDHLGRPIGSGGYKVDCSIKINNSPRKSP